MSIAVRPYLVLICVMIVTTAKARLFVATGTPVQPHSSDGVEGLSVHYRWVLVPRQLFEHVGFADDADSLYGFCSQFSCEVPAEDDWCVILASSNFKVS